MGRAMGVKKIKILHYVSVFSLPSETFIYDFINNLEENGIENYVLTHNRQLEVERPFAKVKVVSEQVSFIKKVYHRLIDRWSIRNQREVSEFIRDYNPDVIHAHFGPNGVKIASMILKKRVQVPIVISMHGTDTTQYPLIYSDYKNTLKVLSKNENIIFTFPSIFLKQEFKKNIGECKNAFVVPNSFNPSFQAESKQDCHEEKIKIISIGRLIYSKAYSDLLEAVALLDKSQLNWELRILGDGVEMQRLKAKAESLGITDKVFFHGFVKHVEVARLLKSSNIYVQPSIVDPRTNQTESFGVAVVEAIVSGLPVVVTNVGGLSDTVLGGDEHFAKIVNPNAPDEICAAIKAMALYSNDNSSFREKVIASYSPEKQLKNVLKIYKRVA